MPEAIDHHTPLAQIAAAATHADNLTREMYNSVILRCQPHGIDILVAIGRGRGANRAKRRVAYNLIGVYSENPLITYIDALVAQCRGSDPRD